MGLLGFAVPGQKVLLEFRRGQIWQRCDSETAGARRLQEGGLLRRNDLAAFFLEDLLLPDRSDTSAPEPR